jgi:glycosyltransferase involved in cell wall biosynthesis
MIRISVLTPTYNRARLLPRVFESIKSSDPEGIEWIIADDASSDGTAEIVDRLSRSAGFSVAYRRREKNGGKHRALNDIVKLARGELVVIMDSDDEFTEGALDEAWALWTSRSEEERRSLGGLVGLSVERDTGEVIGDEFPTSPWIASIIESRLASGVEGDKCEFWRGELLKSEPFPEFEGEPFLPEGVVWNRIGRRCEMLNVNRAWQRKEYLRGGLTDSLKAIDKANPRGYSLLYGELLVDQLPARYKAACAASYWKYSRLAGESVSRRCAKLKQWALPGLLYLVYSRLKA